MNNFGASVSYGMKCPNGCEAIGIIVNAGSFIPPTCRVCNAVMVPDAGSLPVAANVYCAKCNALYGMVRSRTCPTCGGPFSARPL